MQLTTSLLTIGTALALTLASIGTQDSPRKVRVGTYDNRAIAVAYAPSKYNPVAEKMKERERAEQAGDKQRMAKLEQWGQKHQRELHRMGFARVPVDALLAHVADKIPGVAREAGVDVIAWQCAYTGPGVEVIDVTDQLVRLFEPSERTLKFVADLKQREPVDLDEIEAGHEH